MVCAFHFTRTINKVVLKLNPNSRLATNPAKSSSFNRLPINPEVGYKRSGVQARLAEVNLFPWEWSGYTLISSLDIAHKTGKGVITIRILLSSELPHYGHQAFEFSYRRQ